MSVRVMSWVFEHSQARGNDRLVLLAIADQADADGLNAFPSIPTIARMSRVPSRTVQRCLDRLEELGELLVHRPQRQGRGHHNVYAVPMERDRASVLVELGWEDHRQKGDTLSPFAAGESTSPGGALPGLLMTTEGCQNNLLMTSPGGVIPVDPNPTTPPPVTDVTGDSAPVDERGPGEGEVDLADKDAVANFAAYLRIIRRDDHGLDVAAWTTKRVAKAISDAIDEGYDAAAIPAALRELAADPETLLPGRLVGAGPWWGAATRERRQAQARDLLAYAEETTGRRRRDRELVDARGSRQREMFEGLPDDALERLQREATVAVDEDLGRSQAVRPSDRIRARLIDTRALQLAVDDGLVPVLDAIEVPA